jgi:hypothetical protein
MGPATRAAAALAMAAAATIAAGGAAGAAPASGAVPAASTFARCEVPLGGSGCVTAPISANATHHIHLSVLGGAVCGVDFQLINASTGRVVYSAHGGTSWSDRDAYSLNGSYYLKLSNTCWDAEGNIDSSW